MDNKVKYGLKNVHYSVITVANGVPSYATPVPIPGAVNLSLPPAGEKTEFYADDIAYYQAWANDGYEGDLEIALIPDSFRTDVLGETEDANGALIENANAVPKEFALMFEFNGDVNANRHVFYNCSTSRPNVEGKTKEKRVDPQTETLNITASPAVDTGDVKAKIAYGKTGYDTFFSTVYLKNAVTNTASDPAGFSKAEPADINIDCTSTDAQNKVKNVLLDGVPIGGIYLTATGVDVVIDKAVFSDLSNGDYVVAVEFDKGNAVTVTVTVGA